MGDAKDPRLEELLRKADEREALRQAYQDNPTKERFVLFALNVWQQGCTNGGPGECRECNELFLEKISAELRRSSNG